jgi:CO/xanthine dehydrogenase Mo-binding subunit
VGAPDNVFMIESFMDELAAAAGADPIEFRRRHLTHTRLLAVVEAVEKRAQWTPRPSHTTRQPDGDIATGRGFALALSGAAVPGKGYVPVGNDRETIVASVVDLEVHKSTGAVRVKKVTVAHDCGLIINPENVSTQVEGAVIQGISRAMTEEVTFSRSAITSLNWSQYQIARFPQLPEAIDIVLIDRPELPAVGAGEAALKNIWACIANAIFDATGVRLRQLPFTPQRMQQGLAALKAIKTGEAEDHADNRG